MRSILVVPLGDPDLLDQAFAAHADAVVLDLAGGLRNAAELANARDILRTAQIDAHRPHLYVRLDDLDREGFDMALAAVMIGEPDGILLAACRSGMDVQQLAARLAVQEAEYGLTDGETGIIAEVATARGLFRLATYPDCHARLVGLSLHAASLGADLGSDHHGNGAPFVTARHMSLFAARAAEVAAIDAATDTLDEDAFRAACEAARRDGFNAKITSLPDQVAIINAVFSLD